MIDMASAQGIITKRKDFSEKDVAATYAAQERRCANCHEEFPLTGLQADHDNGDRSNNLRSNCKLLCQPCHSATLHELAREEYLAELNVIKGQLDKTLELALAKQTNGSVLDSIRTLVNERRAVMEQIR
jgi:hypothetical protein